MINYYYDSNGNYTGSAAALPNTIPPRNAVRFAPPERAGFHPVLNDSRTAWELIASAAGFIPHVKNTTAAKQPDNETMVYVTARGTWHRSVSCARTEGEWLPYSTVRTAYPDGRRCQRCRPFDG